VDDRLRHPEDRPSIGLILCRTRGRVIAEYALRDVAKPIGVSRYVTRLVLGLPEELRGRRCRVRGSSRRGCGELGDGQ